MSSDELLCTPFLDTDTRKDTAHADAVLQSRGYPRWLIRLLRRVFAIGLWTQAFMWEECSLSFGDVLIGYCLLLLPIGFFTFAISFKAALWLIGAGLFLGVLGAWLIRRRGLKFRQHLQSQQESKP